MDLIFIMSFMALILFITDNQSSSKNVTAADEFDLLLIILTRCQKEVTHLYRWVMNFDKDSENIFDN